MARGHGPLVRNARDLRSGFTRALGEAAPGARLRMARGLGAPALIAIGLSAIGSSIYFVLGVVAEHALGATPFVFGLAGAFFVVTTMAYLEGNSIHPERGGASTFARYAFNELWSFIAGWAILLDYLIVMALGIVAIPHYLEVFWPAAGDDGVVQVIAGLAIGWVAWSNIRGRTADRIGLVLRLGLLNVALLTIVLVVGGVSYYDPGAVVDTIELGSRPQWDELLYGLVIACVALTGIEAASGLAGEIRVNRPALRRVVAVTAGFVTLLFIGVSVLALQAQPVIGDSTGLGAAPYLEAPVLGVVAPIDPAWLRDGLEAALAATGVLVLLQAVDTSMLGVSRLAYSLATNRQIPSAVGRLHPQRSTPYVAIVLAAVAALALALPADIEFLAGIFAFGAMLAFALAHISIIVLRYREPGTQRPFRVPIGVRLGRGQVPLPLALGGLFAVGAWISVLAYHEGARVIGGIWMLGGFLLYAVYRKGQGKELTKRFTIPAAALQDAPEAEYGSILVPVFGSELDDDIMGTAGRLAAEEAEEGEGGPVIEALYVVEVPMSLPYDARVPPEKIETGRRALSRAKEVGEEYEGVEVATAMVRGRSLGAAIVAEAKRRGVEAIVLAAEEPTRVRGGALLGGRGGPRDKFVGEMTRYVVEKAPCRVILTAPPAGEEGTREGVAP